jgi:hypothetical protein
MLGFVQANWIWILLVVGMFVMHRKHGGLGCGGHQSQQSQQSHQSNESHQGDATHSREG